MYVIDIMLWKYQKEPDAVMSFHQMGALRVIRYNRYSNGYTNNKVYSTRDSVYIHTQTESGTRTLSS